MSELEGDGNQAETYLGRFDGQRAVIKAVPHPDVPVARDLEWWMLQREARALRRLQDLKEVPDLLGFPKPYAFAMEYRNGQILRNLDEGDLRPSYFDRLEETVHAIHERGIVHSDLKRKENLMVSPDHEPIVIDFGTHFRKKSKYRIVNQFLYEQFHQMDLNAVSKLKNQFCPEAMTERDKQRLNEPVLLEKLDRARRNYVLDW